MQRLTFGLGFLLLLILAHASSSRRVDCARGQASPPVKTKPKVDERAIRGLIAQLGDDSYEKREAAQKKLIAVGRPALALVRKASTESTDAEVRERTAEVLRVLRAMPGPGFLIPGGNVFDLAFSKDGHLLAVGCDDGAVRLYDARTNALRHTLHGHRAIVYGVAFSPDGKKLMSCSGAYNRDGLPPGEIILWDLATGRAEATLPGPRGGFAWITLSPEGKQLYSVGSDGLLRLWDLSARKEIKAVSGGNNRPVRRSSFTPDGKLLATAGMDSAVRFWTPGNLTLTRQVQAHPTGAGTLAFSPDGKYLITASRAGAPPTPGAIKVWDLASLTEKRAITGHQGKVLALAVSPDSTLLAVGGGISQEYGEVKLFDLATGAERASFAGHDEWVECVTFSADGQWLASGSGFSRGRPGQVRIWDVKRRVARGE